MPIPARTVSAAIGLRLPGVGDLKLHKLLYFAQGHHVAAFRTALFGEHLEAWEHGPVVAALWREMKHGLPVDDAREAASEPLRLTEAELNTIGFVVARYGAMTGRDLEDLTHQQAPWKDAWARGAGGERITVEAVAQYFATYAERSDRAAEHDEPGPDPAVIRAWLRDAPRRRQVPAHRDDMDAIRALARP